MKAGFFLPLFFVLASFLGCVPNQSHKDALWDGILNKKLVIDSIGRTFYYKTDTSYVFANQVSVMEDSVQQLADVLWEPKDEKGNSYKIGILLYELVQKKNGVTLYTYQPLNTHQVNVEYKEPVYNAVLREFRDRCNRDLEYQERTEDGRFIYSASWNNWEQGRVESVRLFIIPEVQGDIHNYYIEREFEFDPNEFKLHLL